MSISYFYFEWYFFITVSRSLNLGKVISHSHFFSTFQFSESQVMKSMLFQLAEVIIWQRLGEQALKLNHWSASTLCDFEEVI